MNRSQALENKAAAKLCKEKTFMGEECKRLHGGQRYVVNGGCVMCIKMRKRIPMLTPEELAIRKQSSIRKKAALANGESMYIGADCPAEHGGERYAKGGSCVQCIKVKHQLEKEGALALLNAPLVKPVYLNGFLL